MTNGEKIKAIFPNVQIDEGMLVMYVWLDHEPAQFTKDWWNTEYEEPTTKNDNEQEDITWIIGNDNVQIAVRNMPIDMMQKICSIIGNNKNDLGVDCIDRQATLDSIIKRLGIKNESYLLPAEKTIYQQIKDMPSVTPQPCEDAVSRQVDCISRAEVKKIAKEMYLEVANMELDVNTISDCISYTSSKCREVLERKLRDLPLVTPQEPRKGHWIYAGNSEVNGLKICKCSNCEKKTYGSHKFCPNCGADMER